ncbi:MAG: hypothetical protein MI863_26320 [Desulfobacterales bacterium]|nr:hypothetical protein [Desulfobacterales bacterium]
MKLTNPETIQESEKEFIDTINAELDWDAIEKMLLDKHGFVVQEDVDYKEGNLVVHNNQIAYKFEFEIKVPLSVIFNREGECLDISTQRDEPDEDIEPMEGPVDEMDETDTDAAPKVPGKAGEMASEIADMISEINKEGE